MTITIGQATLCAGDARKTDGTPVGPADLVVDVAPGVETREFVGADRVQAEHVRCDHGTLSFRVTRTFPSAAAASAWIAGAFVTETTGGQVRLGGTSLFGPLSAVTRRVAALVGCTVAVNYTIEG